MIKSAMPSSLRVTVLTLNDQSKWITGQVPAGMPAMKSVALLQIVTLQQARGLLDHEIERLIRLYEAAEQSQR
jgi:hypothetical protein